MRLIIALIFFLKITGVYADTGLYGIVKLGQANFDAETLDFNASLKYTGISVGYMFFDNLGLEVRAGTKLGDDETTVNILGIDTDTRISLDSYYSAYLRPELNLGVIKLYGLVGYTEASLDISSDQFGGFGITGSNDGPSYGLGLGINTSDSISITAEYLELIDSDGFQMDGFNFGVKFFFE